MLNDEELERATTQLEEFSAQSERLQSTRVDVVRQCQKLIEDYERLKSDFEEERDLREKYKQMVKTQDKSPFVVVLIDGDGYIFNDHLISGGVKGGQIAAQMLNEIVQGSLASLRLDHCSIMVRIYANLAGLSRASAKAKLCGTEPRSLATFVANFNRCNEFFDFVDAGNLKENADFKIRGMFRHFISNIQCRHIFFAGCHDSGYLSELAQCISGNRDRITLVRNYAFCPEFGRLGLPVEDFRDLFRGTSLDTAQVSDVTPIPQVPIPLGPAAEGIMVCPHFRNGKCVYGQRCRWLHVQRNPTQRSDPSIVSMNVFEGRDQQNEVPNTNGPINAGFDNEPRNVRSGAVPTLSLGSVLPHVQYIPPGRIPVNKTQQRLDPYLLPPTQEDRTMFQARRNTRKLCYAHHLGGHCINGDDCVYDHNPAPPGIIRCLRQISTNIACPMKGMCRSLTCIRGHICQRSECKFRNGTLFCKFSAVSHSPDFLTWAECVPARISVNGTSPDGHEIIEDDRERTSAFASGSCIRNFGVSTIENDSDPEDPNTSSGALLTHREAQSPVC